MKEFKNFNLNIYTEIVFGKDTENEVGALVKKHGGTKVLFAYGGGSIKRSGLYDRVVKSLNDAGVPFVELGGIQPNPRRSLVEKGYQLALDEKVDFFLGVGGGSSIDTAKAIALAVANDGEYWPYYNGVEPKKMAPVGTINTIAAAGSETSRSSVLVDDLDGAGKHGFMWEVGRPVFAIMNPELTYTLPAFQTGAGSADVFSHTYMRYLIRSASYLGDKFAESLMRSVVKFAPIAIAEPTNYEARAELMLAASFSHNDITAGGRPMGSNGGEHALESQLSGVYDTAHGAGLAVMMPALLEYLLKHGTRQHIEKVAQFAVNVFDVEADFGDLNATGTEGIRRFRAWLTSIGMPITLKELGVPKEDIPAAVKRTMTANAGGNGIIGAFLDLDAAAVSEIYDSVAE
jgi:alcohol dehydrogenase YqhD (iron-dependent ADH family)